MKTIATINFKGGVGKTTLTWCLGDVLSVFGNSKTSGIEAAQTMREAYSAFLVNILIET